MENRNVISESLEKEPLLARENRSSDPRFKMNEDFWKVYKKKSHFLG
jgi:hypothetical protein